MSDLLTSLSQYSIPEHILEQIKLLENKVKLIEDKEKSTEYFKNKVKTIFGFVKYLDNISNTTCKIYGSFVRQYFERCYMSIYDSNYGNTYNHDVDISVFGDIYGDIYNTDNSDNIEYNKYNDNYEKVISILKKLDNTIFNNYIIHEINDKTKNVPHNEIILLNIINQDKIKIDLLAFNFIHKCEKCDKYKICTNKSSDYDVNNMYMTSKYIKLQDDINFYDLQENIIDKKNISFYPMHILNDNLKVSMDRSKKVIVYNHFIKFITFRTKIYLNGYNKTISNPNNKLYKIDVETKDNCPIIDAEPPYINLYLQCSHIISLMAFTQIVNIRSSEYTESILCPYCRSDLIPLVTEDELIINNNILMSPENMSIIVGILNGHSLDEINESHHNGRYFENPVVYIDNNIENEIFNYNDDNVNDVNDDNENNLENDDDETLIRNMQEIIDNLSPQQTAEIYLNYITNQQVNNNINIDDLIDEFAGDIDVNDVNDVDD